MKTITFACTVLLPLFPVDARAGDPPRADGVVCGYTSLTDPLGPDGTQLGEMDGGPILAAELPAVDPEGDPTLSWDVLGNPARVTLTCDLQVDTWTHDGADTVTVSASGTAVATVPPTLVRFPLTEDQTVFLCTSVTVADAHGSSGTLRWDAALQEWTTDPGARCDGLLPAGDGVYVPFLGDSSEALDAIACPVLALVFPPDGDVPPGIWDCPPYSL